MFYYMFLSGILPQRSLGIITIYTLFFLVDLIKLPRIDSHRRYLNLLFLGPKNKRHTHGI